MCKILLRLKKDFLKTAIMQILLYDTECLNYKETSFIEDEYITDEYITGCVVKLEEIKLEMRIFLLSWA